MADMREKPLELLVVSSLYPSSVTPRHGQFVESRMLELRNRHNVRFTVLSPVPWFPFRWRGFGAWAVHASQPRAEARHDIWIRKPRYLAFPYVGKWIAPVFIALSLIWSLRGQKKQLASVDVVDAHYFWPEAPAAAILSWYIGKPLVVTARGSDINHFSQQTIPRAWIRWTARRASKVVTVSEALRQRICELGVAPAKVTKITNGVDLQFFRPDAVNVELPDGLADESLPLIVSVGNLVPLKGHDLVIQAMASLECVNLLVIGDGPERQNLQQLIDTLGIGSRVSLIGPVPRQVLKKWYGRADLLVLASSREGFANVLLESLASGTPVVATDVGGNSEIVTSDDVGMLIERSAEAVSAGVTEVLDRNLDRQQIRDYAQQFDWGESSSTLHDVLLSASVQIRT